MALSKPIFHLLGFYFEQLFTHPVRTKSITSGILASSANLVAQKINGAEKINIKNLRAFALYGLIFGGTLPHYFYRFLNQIIPLRSKYAFIYHLLIERLVFAPFLQAFSIYMVSLLEGKSHKEAKNNLNKLYLVSLRANLKYLTLSQYINFRFIPAELRVLYTNLIGFIWVIFLANIRIRNLKGH